jgi:hypothetical protein
LNRDTKRTEDAPLETLTVCDVAEPRRVLSEHDTVRTSQIFEELNVGRGSSDRPALACPAMEGTIYAWHAGRLQVCGMEGALTVAQVIGGRLKDQSGSRVDDSWRARVTGPLISGGRATGLRERLSWSSWSVKPL